MLKLGNSVLFLFLPLLTLGQYPSLLMLYSIAPAQKQEQMVLFIIR